MRPLVTQESENREPASGEASVETPPQTAPNQIVVSAQGFEGSEAANRLANTVCEYLRALSSYIDLATLDGVTIAHDYVRALRELDRGRDFATSLTPTEGDFVGVAMTPSVWRDGAVKSHIVFHAGVVWALEDPASEHHSQALYVVAHEAAHVEVSRRTDAAFPGLIGSNAPDLLWGVRWDQAISCWDEYAASLISAPFGLDQSSRYEDSFIQCLETIRDTADDRIKKYQIHRDFDRVLRDAFESYGRLFKMAGYHLGNLAGRSQTWKDRQKTVDALEGHWFEKSFQQLAQRLAETMDAYGIWTDDSMFQAIADLIEQTVAEGGVSVERRAGGVIYVHVA